MLNRTENTGGGWRKWNPTPKHTVSQIMLYMASEMFYKLIFQVKKKIVSGQFRISIFLAFHFIFLLVGFFFIHSIYLLVHESRVQKLNL